MREKCLLSSQLSSIMDRMGRVMIDLSKEFAMIGQELNREGDTYTFE